MKFLFIILLTTSIYAINIEGTWKLSSITKTHPFNCCALIGYGTILKFNKDGTITPITKHQSSITGTHKRYKLNGNHLNVYLENKKIGMIASFFMKYSSSNKTFVLKQIDKNCYKATDIKDSNNLFIMCKSY